MGGIYLSCFKALHTFQMYREATEPDKSVEVAPPSEEFLDTLSIAVRAWARYCPLLREVQFEMSQMWRRGDVKDKWCQRSFEWVDGQREMIIGERTVPVSKPDHSFEDLSWRRIVRGGETTGRVGGVSGGLRGRGR